MSVNIKPSYPQESKYCYVVPMTPEEKFNMYMKEPKEKLAEMLIVANNILNHLGTFSDVCKVLSTPALLQLEEEITSHIVLRNKQAADSLAKINERIQEETEQDGYRPGIY